MSDHRLPHGLDLSSIGNLPLSVLKVERVVKKDPFPLGFQNLHNVRGEQHGYLPPTKTTPERDEKNRRRKHAWLSAGPKLRTLFALAKWIYMEEALKDEYKNRSTSHAIYGAYLDKLMIKTEQSRNEAQQAYYKKLADEAEQQRERQRLADMERKAAEERIAQWELSQRRMRQEEASRIHEEYDIIQAVGNIVGKVLYHVYDDNTLIGEYDRYMDAWCRYRVLLEIKTKGKITIEVSDMSMIESMYVINISNSKGKDYNIYITRSTLKRAEDTISEYIKESCQSFSKTVTDNGDKIVYSLVTRYDVNPTAMATITKKPYVSSVFDSSRVAAHQRDIMRAEKDKEYQERQAQVEKERIVLEAKNLEMLVEESKKTLYEDYDKLMLDAIAQSVADQETEKLEISTYYEKEELLREAAEKRKKIEQLIDDMLDADEDADYDDN